MRFFTPPLFFLLLIFTARTNASTVTVAGDVSGQWIEDTVLVTSDIQVPYGQNLNIKGGCKIFFKGYYAFTIWGSLLAIGDSSHLIHFTASDTSGFYEQSGAGAWAGLVMKNSVDISKLHYCVFQYTKAGSVVNLEYGYSQFHYCQFYNNRSQYVFYSFQKKNEIRNCIIARNSGLAMIMIAGTLFGTTTLENNTIVNNNGYAIYHYGYVSTTCILSNDIFWDNFTDDGIEIHYDPYSSYGFDTSSLVLRNCIIQNGSRLTYFNNSCFEQYPSFKDTANYDFSLQWSNFPVNDATRSIAIDNGYYLSVRDPDSTRADIGAISFYRPDGPSLTWVSFSMDTTLGYQSNHTVHFANLSNKPNPGTTWLWNFGDGGTSPSFNPLHTYKKAGKFTVKLVATQPGGHKDSLVLEDAITVLPGSRVNGGAIGGVWSKDHSPYYVYGDVTVDRDKKLEIREGVTVEFMGPFSMDVFGSMFVKGNIVDTVRFQAHDTTGMGLYKGMNIDFPDADFQRNKGWAGIHFVSDSARADSCIMEYARISDVRSGNPNANTYRGALKLHRVKTAIVRHSVLINNFTTPNNYIDEHLDTSAYNYQTAGIAGYGTSPDIEDNWFENLYQYAPTGIYLSHADSARIVGNSFFNIANGGAALEGIKAYQFINNTFDSIGSICLRLRDSDYGEQRDKLNEVDGNMFSNSGRGISAGDIYKVRFSRNLFKSNIADIDVALTLWGDSLFVSQNLFYNNRVTGAIGNVGGTCINFLLNRSMTGVIANNTLVDNNGSFYQPIIYGDDALRVNNNIVRNRSGKELQGTFFTNGWFFSDFTKSYSNNVKGGYSSGVFNYDDPGGFADSANHDYRLKKTSFSINRGSDTTGLLLDPFDFFGNQRVDTFTKKIDVGFFEYISKKPVQLALSSDTIQENRSPYTAIGDFTTSDPDTGDVFSYSFTSIPGIANNNNEFTIIGSSLLSGVTFQASQGDRAISIRTTDQSGAYLDTSFTISIKSNVVTGLPSIQLRERYSVYPNPVYDHLTLEPRQQQKGTWSIYSPDGKILLSGAFRGKTNIGLNVLPKGIYLFKFVDHQTEYCIEFVKQ